MADRETGSPWRVRVSEHEVRRATDWTLLALVPVIVVLPIFWFVEQSRTLIVGLAAAVLALIVAISIGYLFVSFAKGADMQRLPDAATRSRRGAGRQLAGVDLSGARLIGVDLRYADLAGARLEQANLSSAHLEGALLAESDLTEAVLVRALLRGADLRGADLTRADLAAADLTGADLRDANLQGASAVRARLDGAKLERAKLQHANLEGASLKGIDEVDADFRGARGASPWTPAKLSGSDVVRLALEQAWLRVRQIATLRMRSEPEHS